MHLINSIGESVDGKTCKANVINLHDRGLLTDEQAKLIMTAVSDNIYKELPEESRNKFRASMFKQMLLSTMK